MKQVKRTVGRRYLAVAALKTCRDVHSLLPNSQFHQHSLLLEPASALSIVNRIQHDNVTKNLIHCTDRVSYNSTNNKRLEIIAVGKSSTGLHGWG